eukprot:1372965-Rhodomonas_salina.1
MTTCTCEAPPAGSTIRGISTAHSGGWSWEAWWELREGEWWRWGRRVGVSWGGVRAASLEQT